jgi:hypothetical protein
VTSQKIVDSEEGWSEEEAFQSQNSALVGHEAISCGLPLQGLKNLPNAYTEGFSGSLNLNSGVIGFALLIFARLSAV